MDNLEKWSRCLFMILFSLYAFPSFGQGITVKFEAIDSKIVDDKKTKKITHYIPVIVQGTLKDDITINVEDTQSGTANSKRYAIIQNQLHFKAIKNKNSYRGIIELKVDSKEEKLSGTETIALKITTNSNAKITQGKHSVFIHYTGKYNYLTTSIGTNFDFLNGGVQVKKVYWDINYFNPGINNSRTSMRFGLYQNRNFSIDSTRNRRFPFNENLINVERDSILNIITIQRQEVNISNVQTTIDNYGFFGQFGLRLNRFDNDVLFFLELYSETILRKFTQTLEGSLGNADTISVSRPIDEPITLRRTTIGTAEWTSFDIYLGAGATVHHVNDIFEFNFSPYLCYNFTFSDNSADDLDGLCTLIKMNFKERNTGIKLNFEFRTGGSFNNIFALSVSKSFAINKADLFKKI